MNDKIRSDDSHFGEVKRLPSPRAGVLAKATNAVMQERNNTYGPPHQDFKAAAEMASVLLGHEVTAHQIAQIQICVKLSRSRWSPAHEDHWVDIAGYAACGYEAHVYEQQEAALENVVDVDAMPA